MVHLVGWRARIVHLGMVSFALAIAGKTAHVQVVQGAHWTAVARGIHYKSVTVPGVRGEIRDATGALLAQSVSGYRLAIAPREVTNPERLRELLLAAEVSPRLLARALDSTRAWVQLPGIHASSPPIAELLTLRGVYADAVADRTTPAAEVTRALVGRTTADGRGLDGIERKLDTLLRGTPGRMAVAREVGGRPAARHGEVEVPPSAGAHVTLTLHESLQDIVAQALATSVAQLDAEGGDVIVLDPSTGAIRAMVSQRASRPVGASSPAVSEPFEPGSTVKPFIAAALLERGRARVDEVINTEGGQYTIEGRTITDSHRAERMSMHDVLRYSSNIGIVKFAARLSHEEQYAALRTAGFGTRTGIEFPAEAGGRLRAPDRWSAQSAASLAMGYELTTTAVQLAAAYGAIANGGTLLKPTLVARVEASDGTTQYVHRPVPVRRVMRRGVADTVLAMLASVVESGTGSDAAIAGFTLAGKTGTARRSVGGRYDGSYVSSFVGMFPAEDPQLVIVVKLENPRAAYYGGKTAAPVARAVLEGVLATRSTALNWHRLARHQRLTIDTTMRARAPEPDSATPSPAAAVATVAAPIEAPRPTALPSSELAAAPEVRSAGDSIRRAVVPSIEGRSVREAVHALHRAGFRVRLTTFGTPVGTEPVAGSYLPAGSMVRLVTMPDQEADALPFGESPGGDAAATSPEIRDRASVPSLSVAATLAAWSPDSARVRERRTRPRAVSVSTVAIAATDTGETRPEASWMTRVRHRVARWIAGDSAVASPGAVADSVPRAGVPAGRPRVPTSGAREQGRNGAPVARSRGPAGGRGSARVTPRAPTKARPPASSRSKAANKGTVTPRRKAPKADTRRGASTAGEKARATPAAKAKRVAKAPARTGERAGATERQAANRARRTRAQ